MLLTWSFYHDLSSVQFSSVTQSCLTLCDPVDCNTPGLPVHHQFPEVAQTHVHWVGDAIQPPHPLSSPSPPAFNLSQHLSLFLWISWFFASGGQSIGALKNLSISSLYFLSSSPIKNKTKFYFSEQFYLHGKLELKSMSVGPGAMWESCVLSAEFCWHKLQHSQHPTPK